MMITCFGCEVSILTIIQSLIGFFIAAALAQSGLDKITDRKGNMDWLMGHFSKTFLSSSVPIMLTVVTLLELAGGLLCGIGALMVLFGECSLWLMYGLTISGVNFLMLFFGQRIAKDYEGAAVLVGYFILVILGLLTFTI
ncbi:MAG TPA: DoxX family protein [Candidatus Marinimicrobia bacterium]|nr:DoxX family protein [Candidatus Neomarinimicrobiota bacterium]